MRVGVYYCGFWEIHLVASSKHVFSNCWSWHIPVLENPSVLCQGMIQCPACLPDVHPWAFATGDAVHHPFPLLLWDRVFRMDQFLFEGPKRPKGDLNGQGAQHSANWLWQAMDVEDSHWCPCCLLFIPWDWLWETVPRDESDRVPILLKWLLYTLFFPSPAHTWGGKCLCPAHQCPDDCLLMGCHLLDHGAQGFCMMSLLTSFLRKSRPIVAC